MDLIFILQVLIGVIIFIMMLLILVYIRLMRPKTQKYDESSSAVYTELAKNTGEKKIEKYGRFQENLIQESIFDFMEFDEIVDNMIIRKNKSQYIMILQCNGVNYDLMSEQEKISVEEGFVQFLNTLRFPIQLYVQSRTLNLKDIIAGYKERVNVLLNDIDKINAKIAQAKIANNKPLLEKLEFERRRKENVLSYGIDITEYVEKLNSNQNILQQKTYVVVSFFINELGGNLENYSKDEINNMCFAELYTRCQNVSSALASSQVTSRILDSEELAELLYIAYNRDESEIYQLTKALDAQYDALYSTGKDVLQKRQEKLDKEINIAAIDLATDSILRADKQKRQEDLEKERSKSERIKEMANQLIDTYEKQLNPRVFQIAKQNVENSMQEEKKENVENEEKTKTRTIVKKKSETEKKTQVTDKVEAPKKKIVKKKSNED